MQAPNAPQRNNRSVCQECGQSLKPKSQTLGTFLRDSDLVKEKYLTYTPEDNEGIDCLDTLRWLHENIDFLLANLKQLRNVLTWLL